MTVDREQVRRDIEVLHGTWEGVGQRLAALLAELEQAKRERDQARQALDTLSRWPPHDGILGMCQYAREALAAYEQAQEPRRTHGRGCPCTPCQAEDWDAVEQAQEQR